MEARNAELAAYVASMERCREELGRTDLSPLMRQHWADQLRSDIAWVRANTVPATPAAAAWSAAS